MSSPERSWSSDPREAAPMDPASRPLSRGGPTAVLVIGACLAVAAMFGPSDGTYAGPEAAAASAPGAVASTIQAGTAPQIKRATLQPDLHAQPRGYVAYRAGAPLSIDGRL